MGFKQLQPCRRGFTLYELMLVLVLFSVIGVTAARFIGTVIRTLRSSREEATASARFENALDALRRDVWRASAVESKSDAELSLTFPDHTQVRWAVDSQHHLRQAGSGSAVCDFGVVPSAISFKVDGSAVRVTAASSTRFHGGTCSLVSPIALESKP